MERSVGIAPFFRQEVAHRKFLPVAKVDRGLQEELSALVLDVLEQLQLQRATRVTMETLLRVCFHRPQEGSIFFFARLSFT